MATGSRDSWQIVPEFRLVMACRVRPPGPGQPVPDDWRPVKDCPDRLQPQHLKQSFATSTSDIDDA
jgi:hypothetical protein